MTPELREQILRVYAETSSCRKTARACNCAENTVLAVVRKERGDKPKAAPAQDMKRTESDSASTIEFTSDKPIRTLDEALEYAEVDTKIWRVDKWECGGWQQGMKLRSEGKDKPIVKQLWTVRLSLKRIQPKAFHDATEAIFKRLEGLSPVWPVLPVPSKPMGKCHPGTTPHLLEIDLSDVHFGKLAWAPECGADYDLKIAETVYKNAVIDLMGMVRNHWVTRIVMPIGSDFYHVDNQDSATSSGTRVDSDGRYAKIIEAGEAAVIWAVEQLATLAPVELLWIPGNHDRIASYHLARTVKAWFHGSDRVNVDVGPTSRKYLRHGTCLIGYTHGDEGKPKDLPMVMATERDDWSATTCHEWHIGHRHKPGVETTTPVASFNGCLVKTLRALTGNDAWHYNKLYVGNPPAAECHLYRSDQGYVGHFVAPARVA